VKSARQGKLLSGGRLTPADELGWPDRLDPSLKTPCAPRKIKMIITYLAF